MHQRLAWLAATVLLCVVIAGCEDASPVVVAEGEAEKNEEAATPVNSSAGEAEEDVPNVSDYNPSREGFDLDPGASAPANPPAGNAAGGKAAGVSGVGNLANSNPFENEPRYNGPGAQGQPPQNQNPNVGQNFNQNNFPPNQNFNQNNNSNYKPADVGTGKKGRSLRNETGIGRMIAQPAVSFYATRDKTALKFQIPSAMKLFKGTNGHFPRSHQEFMTKIIQANRIQLPELPRGQRYVYDPRTAQLMVEFPANQQRR